MSIPQSVFNSPSPTLHTLKQIIDRRDQVIPGGSSIQKLIGLTPLLVEHHGHASVEGGARRRHLMDEEFGVDDSFNDLSLAAGDVSVQVVRNSNR